MGRLIPILAGIVLIAGATIVAAQTPAKPGADRAREGDWFISDFTDNNTGEREVSATQMHVESNDPDFVTIRLRCSKARPTVFVEWADLALPDQTVLTIGPVDEPEVGEAGEGYVFAKSTDPVESGYRATSETSAKIVSALGQTKFATITAHLSTGPRSVGMDVAGTQRAWARVVRHCPVRTMARPPL